MFLTESLDEKFSVDEKWDSVIDKRNDILSYCAKCCKPKVTGHSCYLVNFAIYLFVY